MGAIGKLNKPQPDRDRVVVIDDAGNADIAYIYEQDDQAYYADSATQDYAIPKADVIPYVGPGGRIFVLAANFEYVADTQRLAELEKSIVMRHVTHFQKPPQDAKGGLDIKQILLYALIGVLILAVIFK